MPPESHPPVRKIWNEKEIIKLLKALSKSTNGNLTKEEIKNIMALDDPSFKDFKSQISIRKKYIDYEQISTDPVKNVWCLTDEGQEFLDKYEEKERERKKDDRILKIQKNGEKISQRNSYIQLAIALILLITAFIYGFTYLDTKKLIELQIKSDTPLVAYGNFKCPKGIQSWDESDLTTSVSIPITNLGKGPTSFMLNIGGENISCYFNDFEEEIKYRSPCNLSRVIGASSPVIYVTSTVKVSEKKPKRFFFRINLRYNDYGSWVSVQPKTCVYDLDKDDGAYGIKYKLNTTRSG